MIKAAALLIALAALPTLGSAEPSIIPTAHGIVGFGLSMPESEWTNCVAWYSAEFPTLGEGTTEYTIPDLSPAGNDATQTGVGYQPERIYTNGAWAWKFDGVDDYVTSASPLGYTNRFRADIDVALLSYGASSGDYSTFFADSYYRTYGAAMWIYGAQDSRVIRAWGYPSELLINLEDSIAPRFGSEPAFLGRRTRLSALFEAGTSRLFIDNVEVLSKASPREITTSPDRLYIGRARTTLRWCNMVMHSLKVTQ